MDLITKGEEPAKTNVEILFPVLWEKAGEDLRKTLGVKYHTYVIDSESDDSSDKGAKTRLFELLIQLNAVCYIPEGTRARIYRRAAEKLAFAKNSSYGWRTEESASTNLLQLAIAVPSVAFEEVYQEILAVWLGNYWGRSDSYTILESFITALNTDQIRNIIRMFKNNNRVRDELSQRKPKNNAIELLESFKTRLTIEAHKQELREIIEEIKEL